VATSVARPSDGTQMRLPPLIEWVAERPTSNCSSTEAPHSPSLSLEDELGGNVPRSVVQTIDEFSDRPVGLRPLPVSTMGLWTGS
jgi:hypothetical protein